MNNSLYELKACKYEQVHEMGKVKDCLFKNKTLPINIPLIFLKEKVLFLNTQQVPRYKNTDGNFQFMSTFWYGTYLQVMMENRSTIVIKMPYAVAAR